MNELEKFISVQKLLIDHQLLPIASLLNKPVCIDVKERALFFAVALYIETHGLNGLVIPEEIKVIAERIGSEVITGEKLERLTERQWWQQHDKKNTERQWWQHDKKNTDKLGCWKENMEG